MSALSNLALSQAQVSLSFVRQQADASAQVANIVQEATDNLEQIVQENQASSSTTNIVDIIV